MNSDHRGPRKSAGRIGAIVLKAILVVIAMALPLSAEAPGIVDDFRESQHRARQSRRRDAAQRPGADRRRHRQLRRKPLTQRRNFQPLLQHRSPTLPAGLAAGVSGLTATVLNDNTVLLAGGLNSAGKSVNLGGELYDPAPERVHQAACDEKARSHHTATLLLDGRVLIAGGDHMHRRRLANLEIFNPATRTFTAAAPLKHARQDHTATLLVRRHGADRGRRRMRRDRWPAPRFSIRSPAR